MTARALVDRIGNDMEELRAAGISIWGVGIGEGDQVVVMLEELRPEWIKDLRERYGSELRFDRGGPVYPVRSHPVA